MSRRGDTWRVIVELPPDPLTGKRRRAYGTAKSEKAAHRLKAQLITNGQPEKTARRTVADLLAAWQAHIAPDRSPSTMLGYRRKIDAYVVPRLGEARLDRVRAVHLDELYRTLRASGGDEGKALSAQTVRHVHAILHAAFAQGRRWGWVAFNPAEDASPPPVEREPESPPSAEEIARLYQSARKDDAELALLIWLAAVTGARRGELCGLRWSDLEGERLRIARSIVVTSGELRVKTTKTGKVRRPFLDPDTLALVQVHREFYDARAKVCGDEVLADGFLLSPVADCSEPVNPDVMGQRFIRLGAKLGIDCHLHLLRHWAATHALDAGVSLRTVAGRLGQDPRTTLGRYAHALEASDVAAAEVLVSALSGARTPDRSDSASDRESG